MPGGCYFFTVKLLERRGNDLLIRQIDFLRDAVRLVRQSWPFTIDAWVVLPDHLHSVWTLPPDDDDFATRWRLIKSIFARSLPPVERRSTARRRKAERGIWQRRYWEHAIRAMYQRLLAVGKSKMSALGAATRKLVHIAFGVLKHQKPFDPNVTA